MDSVRHSQAGKVRGLLCNCREQQQGPDQAHWRLPHQVQQEDEQGATTMSRQQMTFEVLLPLTLPHWDRQDFIYILLFD